MNISIDWNKQIRISEEKLDKIRKIIDVLYLVALGLFFLKTIFEASMIDQSLPFDFYDVIKKILVPLVILKVVFSWNNYKRVILQLLGLGVVAHMMYIIGDFEIQMYVWLLAVGAVNIPYQKIIKLFFLTAFFVLFTSMLASLTGMAPNLIYEKNNRLRYSFGICYPTDFAACLLFTSLMGWVSFGRGRELIFSVLFVFEAVFIYIFCNAWCGYLMSGCAAVAAAYVYMLEKGRLERFGILERIIWFLEKYAFIIGAIVMISMTCLYRADSPIMSKLNVLLSGRLGLARSAFEKYGIHAFGRYFAMHGNGGSEVFIAKNYNFVDSSYCLIFVRYGWVLLVVLAAIYIHIIGKAKKTGDEALVAAMAVMAVHSMIEHHWPDIAFNPTLIIFFCSFNRQKDRVIADETDKTVKKRSVSKIGILGLAIYLLILIVSSKVFVVMVRTLVGDGFRTLRYSGLAFMLYALIVISGTVMLIIGLCRLDEKKGRIAALTGLVLYIGVWIYSIVSLSLGYREFKVRFDNDNTEQDVIAWAYELGCGLYVEDVPGYYSTYGCEVRFKPVLENSLCNDKNVVLFTTPGKEYHRLLKSGYAYIKIDADRAVYTDSLDMVYELQDMGFKIVRMFEYEQDKLKKRKRY